MEKTISLALWILSTELFSSLLELYVER